MGMDVNHWESFECLLNYCRKKGIKIEEAYIGLAMNMNDHWKELILVYMEIKFSLFPLDLHLNHMSLASYPGRWNVCASCMESVVRKRMTRSMPDSSFDFKLEEFGWFLCTIVWSGDSGFMQQEINFLHNLLNGNYFKKKIEPIMSRISILQ